MFAGILLLGAGACLLYFIIIVLYSGIGTSAALIWPLAAVVLAASSVTVHIYQKTPERMPLWIPVSLVTLCATGLAILMVISTLLLGSIAPVATPNLDYVIVMGAKVRETGPSKSLKKRLDKAYEYASQNPNTIFVLSGGRGADEPQTEAGAMYDYLLAEGLSEQQMIREEEAKSTLENIGYSYLVISREVELQKERAKKISPQVQGEILDAPDKPVKIGLLTSNYHIFRSVAIAQKRGYEKLQGIAAGADPILLPHFCVRECLAILKDRIVGNL